MSDSKSSAKGADWTGLLADPDLARNLGKLLQTYRDAPPEGREEALLAAMREIKKDAANSASVATPAKAATEPTPAPQPTPASATPPFAPDVFSSNWEQDRRQHPRIRCFVAVEL